MGRDTPWVGGNHDHARCEKVIFKKSTIFNKRKKEEMKLIGKRSGKKKECYKRVVWGSLCRK